MKNEAVEILRDLMQNAYWHVENGEDLSKFPEAEILEVIKIIREDSPSSSAQNSKWYALCEQLADIPDGELHNIYRVAALIKQAVAAERSR